MGRRITSTDAPEWEVLFLNFTHSAFRLETLQHYSEPVEAEDFAQFLAGEYHADGDLSWWGDKTRKHAAAGHHMSRVRIVIEPLTNYTRFEIIDFPRMVDAGDDIRIIAMSEGEWPDGLPHEDYWLIDEHDIWLMVYDDQGALRYAELQDHDEDLLARHLQWRDDAWAQAIPVGEYLAKIGPEAVEPIR